MTRGNVNYTMLAGGGTAADFLRLRDADALGPDPLGAFTRSAGVRGGVRRAAEAPGNGAPDQDLLLRAMGRGTR